jgi:hypothetical protein
MIEEEFIPALIADLVCESLVSTYVAMDGDWINQANVKGALYSSLFRLPGDWTKNNRQAKRPCLHVPGLARYVADRTARL